MNGLLLFCALVNFSGLIFVSLLLIGVMNTLNKQQKKLLRVEMRSNGLRKSLARWISRERKSVKKNKMGHNALLFDMNGEPIEIPSPERLYTDLVVKPEHIDRAGDIVSQDAIDQFVQKYDGETLKLGEHIYRIFGADIPDDKVMIWQMGRRMGKRTAIEQYKREVKARFEATMDWPGADYKPADMVISDENDEDDEDDNT